MGVGGIDGGKKLVLQFESVTSNGTTLLGQIALPSELASIFSKNGTSNVRADWQATQPKGAPVTIASETIPELPAVKGSM